MLYVFAHEYNVYPGLVQTCCVGEQCIRRAGVRNKVPSEPKVPLLFVTLLFIFKLIVDFRNYVVYDLPERSI
jgi:hypothetical protein